MGLDAKLLSRNHLWAFGHKGSLSQLRRIPYFSTFTPCTSQGALVGDIVGNVVPGSALVADKTTFVVVGAAAVLGAACRAPLTAIALMVEITRDTGLLVPLLAAIGTASVVTDYVVSFLLLLEPERCSVATGKLSLAPSCLQKACSPMQEGAFSRWLETKLVEMYVQEKSMFWAASLIPDSSKEVLAAGPKDAGKCSTSSRELFLSLFARASSCLKLVAPRPHPCSRVGSQCDDGPVRPAHAAAGPGKEGHGGQEGQGG